MGNKTNHIGPQVARSVAHIAQCASVRREADEFAGAGWSTLPIYPRRGASDFNI